MIQIRQAMPSELDFVQDFIKTQFRSSDKYPIKSKMSDTFLLSANTLTKAHHMAVCIINGEIVGCGCSVLDEDDCLLNWIYVTEDYRSDGIGTGILKYLLNQADILGVQNAFLLTECIQFAEKNGFKKNQNAHLIENKYTKIMDIV